MKLKSFCLFLDSNTQACLCNACELCCLCKDTLTRAEGEMGTQDHTEVKAAYLVDSLRIRLEKERSGEQLQERHPEWMKYSQAVEAGRQMGKPRWGVGNLVIAYLLCGLWTWSLKTCFSWSTLYGHSIHVIAHVDDTFLDKLGNIVLLDRWRNWGLRELSKTSLVAQVVKLSTYSAGDLGIK